MSKAETSEAVMREILAGIREQTRLVESALDAKDYGEVVDSIGRIDGYMLGLEQCRKYLP